jgi:hypothetical protein
MKRSRERIRAERQQLKAAYGELFDAVAAVLYRSDPIGISFENPNLDEYASEAGTILPRLKNCESADDVLRVVHEEFVRWFFADTAGSPERYKPIAAEIWQLWQQRTSRVD